MAASIEFKGGAELQRKLKALELKFQRQVTRETIKRAAEPIRAEAARLAPRAAGGPTDPEIGHLADNIVVTVSASKNGSRARIGPDRDHFYGLFIEFGTRRQTAKPFLRPAFDSKTQETLDIVQAELAKALEKPE